MKNWIDDIKKLRIIVLGDLMLDRYISGTVDRVSPEAPVPILAYEKTEYRLGGAANVALNLKHMGAEVYLIGVVGNDQEGDKLMDQCKKAKISYEQILRIGHRPTTQKTRYMANDQHLLRVDKETTEPISSAHADQLYQWIEVIINQDAIDLLIFQDYDKGVLSEEFIQRVTFRCQQNNVRILVDPKVNNFWFYKNVDLIKPNLNECAQALNASKIHIMNNRAEVSRSIQQKLNNRITLMTLGSEGIFISDGSMEKHLQGIKVDVSDVCGAGDTVISVAACGLGCGLSLDQIANWSNRAAAWACTQPGVVPIDREKLKNLSI